jgi:hypothetical protein
MTKLRRSEKHALLLGQLSDVVAARQRDLDGLLARNRALAARQYAAAAVLSHMRAMLCLTLMVQRRQQDGGAEAKEGEEGEEGGGAQGPHVAASQAAGAARPPPPQPQRQRQQQCASGGSSGGSNSSGSGGVDAGNDGGSSAAGAAASTAAGGPRPACTLPPRGAAAPGAADCPCGSPEDGLEQLLQQLAADAGLQGLAPDALADLNGAGGAAGVLHGLAGEVELGWCPFRAADAAASLGPSLTTEGLRAKLRGLVAAAGCLLP